MLYKIEKSPIPIIWLDAWVIIKLTKLRTGNNLNPDDTARLGTLFETLFKKVSEGKLICPVAHQREEYDSKGLAEECYELQEELSLGVHFLEPLEITFGQIRKVIQARNINCAEVVISYRDAFTNDPIEQVNRQTLARSSYSPTPALSRLQTKRLNDRGNRLLATLKESNRNNDVKLEEQLTTEYNAILQVIDTVTAEIDAIVKRGPPKTLDEMLELLTVISQRERLLEPISELIALCGGQRAFIAFLQSDDYKKIPTVDISTRLFAYMLTSKPAFRPGDRRDIDQMALALPYSNIAVVDKEMADMLMKHDILKSYPTEVHTVTTIGDLETHLRQL